MRLGLELVRGDLRPHHGFALRVDDAPSDEVPILEAVLIDWHELGPDRPLERIDFLDECRPVALAHDEHPEDEVRVERADDEGTGIIRLPRLGAVGITRRTVRVDPNAGRRRVDEGGCAR